MQPVPEALYDLPELELLDGKPYPKVSPKLTHGLIQGRLVLIVTRCAGERGAVMTEVRFEPGAVDGTITELVPDVAFVARERLSVLRGSAREKPPFSPDIAVEVRSPSDNMQLLRSKIARYLSTGSTLVLDVDPATRTVTAHSATGAKEYSGEDEFRHEAAPWLLFKLTELFSVLDFR